MVLGTKDFVHLPNERIIYVSPPRTSISLQPITPHHERFPFSRQSSTGCVHLTNQRIVYLPAQPTADFQSFSAPLLNTLDTHVAAPFFGPNIWSAKVRPVAGGGIPPAYKFIQLKMTFKDGGAFDFHSNFERIKERLQQVIEQARNCGADDQGQMESGQTARPLDMINFANVHLEELPAYDGQAGPQQNRIGNSTCLERRTTNAETALSYSLPVIQQEPTLVAPIEAPPGYEEVQQQSVANELENQLRQRG
ncbi:hypothetical protein FQN57_002289 [Myotisia sp. PD_48]|nr:hypothetical protein FQN57_002289 [Myotisia sp. PD_48]